MELIDPIPPDALKLVANVCFNYTVAVYWIEPDGNPGLNSATGI
jgi:hypothetical protein